MLRSWEDRFGARLIDVGYADLRLLVERPPRTLQAAQHIAAEQVVLGRRLPRRSARVSQPGGPPGECLHAGPSGGTEISTPETPLRVREPPWLGQGKVGF